MESIKIMISSTVDDLKAERETAELAFTSNAFVELIGADRFNTASVAGNSRLETTRMARECDLYILILGSRYGHELSNGKSATEIEFDAAIKADPTKVLIFKKETTDPAELKQQDFINRVSNYTSGYWRTSFSHTAQLMALIQNSFQQWLKNRANLGTSADFVDHFIRLAKQRIPEPSAQMYYKTEKDNVDLSFEMFSHTYYINFSKKQIYDDFWGCLNHLEDQFGLWLS
ncbi:DUF4062 domain-containing protein [Paenibacillus antri]|uniref:DUF4062 domain-containing protein n=1 Tax=Paenibacillus antri TaxID=2582848 RepID=A0A5R9GP17_9BACL|nr:DUF4062 domain-containing protein [Paenibacillus antri]TLS53935.1 DUF4062 domain-containing protein [Paenibacillus antri]